MRGAEAVLKDFQLASSSLLTASSLFAVTEVESHGLALLVQIDQYRFAQRTVLVF
jgi:hypothetical protein